MVCFVIQKLIFKVVRCINLPLWFVLFAFGLKNEIKKKILFYSRTIKNSFLNFLVKVLEFCFFIFRNLIHLEGFVSLGI